MSDLENHDYEAKHSVCATGSVKREKDDPRTGLEPLSLWLFAGCASVLILGGSYLGAKSAGFDFNKTGADIADAQKPEGAGASAVKTLLEQYIQAGQNAYITCQGCHQGNGMGLGLIPPLVESEWVSQGTERFAQIILNGLQGPVEVNGKSYGGQAMPAQKGGLKDLQIAQIMTFVRHQFGGATDGVVTKEMVADARSRFGDREGAYTVAELSAADVMLPGRATRLGRSKRHPGWRRRWGRATCSQRSGCRS